jgi:hypothetical protein
VTISNNVDEFHGQKVKDFTSESDWQGPKFAYRLQVDWDTPTEKLPEFLDELASQKDASQLTALVIGPWNGDDAQVDSSAIVRAIVKHKDDLSGLQAIFLGDITFEQNEMSWIQQSDVAPLLEAFPRLVTLRVRGGNELAFSKTRHENLQQLIVETGGMPRSVIREICRCEFPNLKHLELWLGVENYGGDTTVEDLQPILTGTRFPQLTYLGLCNSEIVDEIAPVVVNAPILNWLEILDLSNGTLTDTGAQALLNLSANSGLKVLNLSHHYVTPKLIEQLHKTLKCKVIADDPQDPNTEWRSTLVSE